jgi:hypothetical protein
MSYLLKFKESRSITTTPSYVKTSNLFLLEYVIYSLQIHGEYSKDWI